MKMKKLAAVALAVVMSVSMLAGCGSSNDKKSAESSTSANGTATVKTAKDGVLTMATNATFPPYESYEGNDIVGIDADIAKAIADKLGLKLEIQDMEFNSIITAVQSGKADLGLAGMTVTDERKQSVDFTDSYATGIQSVIVKEGSSSSSSERSHSISGRTAYVKPAVGVNLRSDKNDTSTIITSIKTITGMC